MATIELVLDANAMVGEALLWEPESQLFYWIDVKAPALHSLDPVSMARNSWALPSDVGAFALIRDGVAALVALRTGLFVLSFDDGSLQNVAPPPYDPTLHRFNEGACDAAGRFWVGTMFDPLPGHEQHLPGQESLCSWTRADGLSIQQDTAELHNGMAWSPDGKTFYLSHSQQRAVYAFPFDCTSGYLGTRRIFVRISEQLGLPDGGAVDSEGCYWCALHGGSRLHRYAPDGTLLREIMLPISQPTMCAFGGPDLGTLYFTSAREKLGPDRLAREPHAGGLFRLNVGVAGTSRCCFVA